MSEVLYFFAITTAEGKQADLRDMNLEYRTPLAAESYWATNKRILTTEKEERDLQEVASEFVSLCDVLTARGIKFDTCICFWISYHIPDGARGLNLPSAFLERVSKFRPTIDIAVQATGGRVTM